MTRAPTLAGLERSIRPEHEAAAALVGEGLSRVEARMDGQVRSDLPPVRALVEHVERYRGKLLRPMMTLLSGLATAETLRGAAGPEDATEAHVAVGAVLELIHMATLVHDDVLDDAETRRRRPTVNALHGNEAAVILGDYLISAAYHLCSTLDSQQTAVMIGAVTTRLCEGELLQLHHRDDFSLEEETYFEIVERKTAELIGAACELGALHAGADAGLRRAMRAFGMSVGVAFQIQDDVLDLTGDEATVGKSVGKDLEKGKLTLPIIHHLAAAEPAARGRTLRLLEAAQAGRLDFGAIRSALEGTGSIRHARARAEGLVAEAKRVIELAAPGRGGPAMSLLRAAADAAVSRSF